MFIKKMLHQNRRDFTALFECEYCGETVKLGGYDDANFHNNVIPAMVCPKCGKKADDNYVPRETKYPEGFQI